MNSRWLRKVKRLPGRVKLGMRNAPFLRSFYQGAYLKRRAAFKESKLPLAEAEAELAAAIDRDGCILTSMDELPFMLNTPLLESVDRLLPELLQLSGRPHESSLSLSHETIIKYPELYAWGLHEKLLDLAEDCLGLPAFYHRLEIRNDLVNKTNPTPASQWHRDPADYKIFKLIVYLNDVSAGGGPFEFISKGESASAAHALNYSSGYLSDEVMERFVARDRWSACIGSRGSVVIGDTASIFHRIRAPSSERRLSITYTYTSRSPIRIYDEISLPPQDVKAISKHLNERQRLCLFLD